MATREERIARIRALQNPDGVLSDVLDFLVDRIETHEVEPLIPERGVDYFTEDDINEVVGKVRELVSDGVDGQDGEDGKDGQDGRDGVDGRDGTDGKNGRDGRDGKDGKDGENGKDGVSPETKDLLTQKDLIDFLKKGGYRGGGISYLSQALDVVIGSQTNGQLLGWDSTLNKWVPTSSSGGGVTVETPTGAIDSSNVTYAVTATPKWVVSDGVTYFNGAGYSIVGLTITMDIAPSGFIRSIY